jgi:hypothetical protein
MCADITMCSGQDCPIKEKCYRFTAPKSTILQSYFAEPPGKTEDSKFVCEMYWGENSQSIWDKLKDITDGKDNIGV